MANGSGLNPVTPNSSVHSRTTLPILLGSRPSLVAALSPLPCPALAGATGAGLDLASPTEAAGEATSGFGAPMVLCLSVADGPRLCHLPAPPLPCCGQLCCPCSLPKLSYKAN